ncbi:MAG: contractile injection system tape measure protein [Saprospiraceae bacterium]
MRHIIKKQLIELELRRRDDIFILQEKASRYYYKNILPAIEEIFDRISGADEMIQIDRLEINLGTISLENPSDDIRIEDLHNTLFKEIEIQLKNTSKPNYRSHFNATPSNYKKLSLSLNAGEQWIYYIQHGVLTWNTSPITEEWKTLVLEALATDFALVTRLREVISQSSKSLTRIINEHQESFLVKLVEILTAQEQHSLPDVLHELHFILTNLHQKDFVPEIKKEVADKPLKIWTDVIRKAATKTNKPTSLQIAEQILKETLQNQHNASEHLENIEKGLHLLKPIMIELSENITQSTDESLKQTSGSEAAETVPPFLASPGSSVSEEGLFVQHAGLVLLHQFFRYLFKNTGLIEEGKFINREKQEKAILLLHYLVTGNAEPEEYLLAVPKLLCSWPLDEPLESYVTLSEQEKTEANDLLHAAIAQWTILKNTSADGLRDGFLQRNGKMIMQNDNLFFQVEKSAIDVLLDHLPWNLSHIKLPWMSEMIRVEWR